MATATVALVSAAPEASAATTMVVMWVNVLKICLYESVDLHEVHVAVGIWRTMKHSSCMHDRGKWKKPE